MRRDEILALLRDHQAEFGRFGVRSLALFGSFARDEASATSDIDLLVDFEGSANYDRYIGFKHFLEDTLGCTVDLITARGLKDARMRSIVEREAIRVA